MAEQQLRRFRQLSAIDNSLPEQVIRRVAEHALRSDRVAVDAGAFMGLHTKHLLRTCRDGQVVAYEAHPEFAERLTDQFERYEHVVIRPVALQADPERTSVTFQIDDQYPSRSTLHPDQANTAAQTRMVVAAATTLDRDLGDLGIEPSRVGLLKIDVEGAEFDVLRGATELLARGRPLVVFEHGADAAQLGGYNLAEFDAFIRESRYELVAFDGADLSRLNTDYWYFWLVPNEDRERLLKLVQQGFDAVLAVQESPSLSARIRRASGRLTPVAKRTIAHRLPDTVKRRLRRAFPRF